MNYENEGLLREMSPPTTTGVEVKLVVVQNSFQLLNKATFHPLSFILQPLL
jgi:hypothetical protein